MNPEFKAAPLGASSRSCTEGIKLIKSAKNFSQGREGPSYEHRSPHRSSSVNEDKVIAPSLLTHLQQTHPSHLEERHTHQLAVETVEGSGWKCAIKKNYVDC